MRAARLQGGGRWLWAVCAAVAATVACGCGQPDVKTASQTPTKPAPRDEKLTPAPTVQPSVTLTPPTPTPPPTPIPQPQPSATPTPTPSPTPAPKPVPAAEAPSGAAGELPDLVTLTGDMVKEYVFPRTTLTAQAQRESKVAVGDSFPSLTLADPAGGSQPLAAHRGSKLTVVAIGALADPYFREELRDLEAQVAPVYAGLGVKVAAVAVGSSPAETAEAISQHKLSFPTLADPQRTTLAALVHGPTASFPRTYLLDASGKVLWHDTEYSRTTRRNLHVALRSTLQIRESRTAARNEGGR